MPGLERYALAHMKGPPVTLDVPQADALVAQYHQTVGVRGWKLEATSVMYNHTHLVVGVPGDPIRRRYWSCSRAGRLGR
jgi:hypothetical protein